jgi:hypothetical protein
MVPGIYLTICFSFAQYLVICEKKGGMQALWESAKLVRGQWWAVFIRIFVYSLALVALMFVATWIDNATNAQGYATNIITLAISLLGPLFMLYFYQIYNDLKSINKVDATVIPSKTKALYSVLFVVGIIVPASLVIFGGIMASKYATSAYDNLINSDGTYNEENIDELYEQYLQSATAQSQSGEISPSSTD